MLKRNVSIKYTLCEDMIILQSLQLSIKACVFVKVIGVGFVDYSSIFVFLFLFLFLSIWWRSHTSE